jgi:hypothetical protein
MPIFKIAAAAWVSADAVYRMNMESPRTVDWVIIAIDLLVLLIIGLEYGSHLVRNRRVAKRVKKLHKELIKGQEIFNAVPPGSRPEDVDGWTRRVEVWMNDVAGLLAGYSDQSLAAFNHVAGLESPIPELLRGRPPTTPS